MARSSRSGLAQRIARASGDIGIWAVPTLGGQPRPYLEGAAEYDWSGDGSRLAYHTPGPGDPLFVSDSRRSEGQRIFTAPPGLHSHFPLWAPDGKFIYFIQGSLPDKLDIWRIRPSGGTPERITSQNAHLSHPVFLDQRTLLYLASDSDTSALSLYSVDVERRIPHRLTSGPERYTSLAASADGHRLALTLATPKKTFWRLPLSDSPAQIQRRFRSRSPRARDFLHDLGLVFWSMSLQLARARASGSSPREAVQNFGAGKERRSSVVRSSLPMGRPLHFRCANAGRPCSMPCSPTAPTRVL